MLDTIYWMFVEFITDILTICFVSVFLCVAVFALIFLIETFKIVKELKGEGWADGQADN